MIVYVRHLRAAKICLGGARRWWKDKNLDWNHFLSHGIDADILLSTEDAQAEKVVQKAYEE